MRASRALRLNISHGPYFDTSAKAAKSLAAEIGNAIGTVKNRDPLVSHCEVVNLELCTTAADLLAPSLRQLKGCYIIDANPGAGLWSSTINNLLRPKRHILVEDDARFDPFIDRLLQSDPSYSRVRYDGSQSQSLERVLDEGLVPRPEPSSDPFKPSTTLLVLINLTRNMIKYGGASAANHKVRRRERTIDFCREAWLRVGIQKNGPVRILAWIEEGTKDNLIPRSVTGTTTSTAAQRYTTYMHVVTENYSHTARADGASKPEWERTWEVLKKMEASGLQIPANRQNPLHKTLLQLGEDWPYTWERFMNTKPKDLDQLNLPIGKKAYHWVRRGIAPLLQEGDEVMRLERLAVDNSQPKEVRVAAREEYEKRYAELYRVVMSLADARRKHFNQEMDRQTLSRRDPPGTVWDRRPFEPVECRKEDFSTFYDRPLSLVDICPKRPPQQHSPFDLLYWERLVSKLLERSAQPLSNQFDTISPGASELIMPKLSLLRDPLRHGSLHPEHVRTRMLTIEMLDEVVQVWRSWPSRPRHVEDAVLEIETPWIYRSQV